MNIKGNKLEIIQIRLNAVVEYVEEALIYHINCYLEKKEYEFLEVETDTEGWGNIINSLCEKSIKGCSFDSRILVDYAEDHAQSMIDLYEIKKIEGLLDDE